MPYLNIDFGFPDHIKTRRLAGLVGGNAEAEGLLVRLWCHIGLHHGDTGKLPGYTPQEVEAIVRWTGVAGAFVDALCKVGFLHRDADGFRIHDWIGHQGHIGALKARAKAAAKARWGKLKGDSTSNARRIPKPKPKQSSIPSMPTNPADEKTTTKDTGAEAAPPAIVETGIADRRQTPPYVEFVDRWKAMYELMVKEPFKQDKIHFIIAKRLIDRYGYDAAVAKAKTLGRLCEKRSAWFTKGGWSDFTIEKLSNQWNSIIAQASKPDKQDEFESEMKKQEDLRERRDGVLRQST